MQIASKVLLCSQPRAADEQANPWPVLTRGWWLPAHDGMVMVVHVLLWSRRSPSTGASTAKNSRACRREGDTTGGWGHASRDSLSHCQKTQQCLI